MALYEAVKEAMWLKSLVESINLKLNDPIVIFEDNYGCISIASNLTNHKRSKHRYKIFFFFKEQVVKNIVKLNYIYTHKSAAGICFDKVVACVQL